MQKYQAIAFSVFVKPDCVERFMEAASENAAHSRQEAGVLRFEVLQSKTDPCEFMMMEVFKSAEDQAKHLETDHYFKFKQVVPDLLAEPYTPGMFGFVSTEL